MSGDVVVLVVVVVVVVDGEQTTTAHTRVGPRHRFLNGVFVRRSAKAEISLGVGKRGEKSCGRQRVMRENS